MEPTRLSARGLAITSALIWGGGVCLVSIVNTFNSDYGGLFLHVLRSVYPGYNADASVVSIVIVTLYALLDGFVLGLLIAWIYNLVVSRSP